MQGGSTADPALTFRAEPDMRAQQIGIERDTRGVAAGERALGADDPTEGGRDIVGIGVIDGDAVMGRLEAKHELAHVRRP
jgi:hypothetical protein